MLLKKMKSNTALTNNESSVKNFNSAFTLAVICVLMNGKPEM